MSNYTDIQDTRNNPANISEGRFLKSPPFTMSKALASKMGCDLAIPNGDGIGNVICFSRLVESFAKQLGRRISILTAPIDPTVGVVDCENRFPIWKCNPFINEIKNCSEYDKSYIQAINKEQDNCCQFNHFIENICHAYGVPCDKLRPSLYLSEKEMVWAIDSLSGLKRPIVCLHAGGTSSPLIEDPWHLEKWQSLVSRHEERVGFIQIGKCGFDTKQINTTSYKTSIREMMSLIWASDMFIGFDSGPAHIATAFQKPAAVIWDVLRKNRIEEPYQLGFGPSALTRWSYPQNNNLMLLGEKDEEILDLLGHFIDSHNIQYCLGMNGFAPR